MTAKPPQTSVASESITLDSILIQLGDFGKYQSFIFALVCVAVVFHSAVHIAFVFSAKALDYRCEVPNCDIVSDGGIPSEYHPEWLANAVPYKNNKPANCDRYKPFHNDSTPGLYCGAKDFDHSNVVRCDRFVYESEEVTIVKDFGMQCEENTWKLALIGTINNVGQFVGLPIAGILSDRYGRRSIMILGMVFCSLAGIARSFSTNYIWFTVLEFVDAAFGSGTYAAGFVLGVELVGPSKRVLTGTIICCCYAVGEVFVAGVAWWLKDWRPMLLVIYIPPLLLFLYFWIIPESIRWLLSQGRVKEAQDVILKAASVNGKIISRDSLQNLIATDPGNPGASTMSIEEQQQRKDPLIEVFKSVPLLMRFINCCFCWITCTFLFYGITLNSVALAGDSYLDFILTALVEIPAYFATYMTVDRWGRRSTQCGWFLLTGVACIVLIFASGLNEWFQLTIYLLGKFGATAAFTVMYIITSEIFPTPLRQSMMGVCSMVGRIGSMVSPQMPLLSLVWVPLPLVLFGAMATIAGLLSLLFPETLNIKLPDTIEEAENIGKLRKAIKEI